MTTTMAEPKKTVEAPPASDTVTLTIDGQKIVAKKGMMLVEAAKLGGVDIPVFCYHPSLKPVGACRMCLVEIEKMPPKPQTACTTPVADGMVVKLNSPMAKSARNAVVTLLLANHPLDCPVCDKGGECPLQDNTFGHGVGVSRFEEEKRHNDKAFELSERILLDRERCILCYRCVRFHEEVPGDRALAVLDRGSRGEIGVLEGERYDSPMQGNVVDICPVGALTSKEYRFRSRPWDLRKAKGIAKDDPTGANLWIDSRDGRVLRLRPRENAAINDVWIADHTRFDSMPVERTVRRGAPLVRKNGKLEEATWFEGARAAAQHIKHHKVKVLASTSLSNEALAILNEGSLTTTDNVAVWPRLSRFSPKGTLHKLANSKSIVVVGIDPYRDAPILATHIRKAIVPFTHQGVPVTKGGASLVVVGPENGLHRDTQAWLKCDDHNIVAVLEDLCDALEGKGSEEAKLTAARLQERPASIVAGAAVTSFAGGRAVLERLRELLCTDDSFSGAVELVSNAGGARAILGEAAYNDTAADGKETIVVVGDDPHAAGLPIKGTDAKVVWLTSSLTSSLGDSDVPDFVDVVLPLADLYEQGGSFTNLEGIHQGFDAGGVPPGGKEKAKADWEALALIACELGATTPKDLKGLRAALSPTYAFARAVPLNKNTPPSPALNVM